MRTIEHLETNKKKFLEKNMNQYTQKGYDLMLVGFEYEGYLAHKELKNYLKMLFSEDGFISFIKKKIRNYTIDLKNN
jgi:hypothetical protein